MTLVDSSVWIDFFRNAQTPAARLLAELLRTEPIITGDLILAEVLRGFTNELEFQRARTALELLPIIDLGGWGMAIQAARNYRALRSRGITIHSTIDALIATRCIEEGYALLYSDQDFDPFVAHLGLRSALAVN